MVLSKEFIAKVIRESIVDTRKYRYVHKEYCYHECIMRLPIEYLGTTKAIDGWEIVWEEAYEADY